MQGKLDESEMLLGRAFAGQQKTLVSEHPDTMHSMHALAKVLCKQGQPEDAETLYRRAASDMEMEVGPDHPATMECIARLHALLKGQGKDAEAAVVLREAREAGSPMALVDHTIAEMADGAVSNRTT
jgi:pentatricopeptide repeat protein